jgi:oligoribonuclease
MSEGGQRSDLIVWIDLEMTGLDPDSQRIIEIASLVTDGELHVLAEGPELVVHQPPSVLEAMNPWCVEQHGASGLTARVQASTVSEQQAENETLAFAAELCVPGTALLAGNSIHHDRKFLKAQMPRLLAHLHPDTMLDVSTLKELVRRWHPDVLASAPKKSSSHRALDDIRESIRELQHYRDHAFATRA